jgi:hypothetical protein
MSDSYEDVPLKIEWAKDFDGSYLEKRIEFYRFWADFMAECIKESTPQFYDLGLGPFHSVIDAGQAYRERRAANEF